MKAREKNVGWRIDYFITSNSIKEKIQESKIYSEIMRKWPLSNWTTNRFKIILNVTYQYNMKIFRSPRRLSLKEISNLSYTL